MQDTNYFNKTNEVDEIKNILLRYLSFWPYFLFSSIFFVLIAYTYLRYTTYTYTTFARIEILDEAQDSEMALPTAMTIFNRSMVNLENEIGVLSSYRLHKKVAEVMDYNVKFFSVGKLKSTENHESEWFYDYDLEFLIETDTVQELISFEIDISKNLMNISMFDEDYELINNFQFESLNTKSTEHDLPFELSIRDNFDEDIKKSLFIMPIEFIIDQNRLNTSVTETGKDSDQLNLSYVYPNIKMADEFLNTLVYQFDRDGIIDRQLEYKNTMDFVDNRSKILSNELENIENRKKEFKQNNNLSDIETDANININQKFSYDSELFSAISQKSLVEMLEQTLNKNSYDLIPVNIGLENNVLNQLIAEYNLIIRERSQYLISVGENHPFLKNLEKQIEEYNDNIFNSLNSYKNSLQISINNLENKENEFSVNYGKIPENEKILRSIQRELEVKESLFLLLLQKREEAAINFAVVKPSIKIIDNARTLLKSKSPKKIIVYFSFLLIGLTIPFLFLYIRFFLDNKIHTKKHLLEKLIDIPIVAEIPFIIDESKLSKIVSQSSREPLAESIRMASVSLNFMNLNKEKGKAQTILVTSSIKGEGKTVVSVNLASILSSNQNKVLLIGADLRNPQIHKFLNIDKNSMGLSNYIYKNDIDFKDVIIKYNNLDIILSGSIPPNPTELLSSDKFENLIDTLKNIYDYIVIDSSPCVLVSDTFQVSKFSDYTFYLFRANYSDEELCNFINDCKSQHKLKNISIIFNSVGNSSSYGYKYGYQYGYKYGYNYGYGYGYSANS